MIDLETRSKAVDDLDHLRAAEYRLLAVLMGAAPTTELLDRVATLQGDASVMGMAHIELAEAARQTRAEAVSREYFDLFIGVGRGELLPYGSYYQTGFLHERPLARVREDLALLGIERSGYRAEPEDHIAILCEIMGGLAAGDFPADAVAQGRFYERHLAPWAARFFVDLENTKRADFYRSVGRLGRTFIEIESEAFALPQ